MFATAYLKEGSLFAMSAAANLDQNILLLEPARANLGTLFTGHVSSRLRFASQAKADIAGTHYLNSSLYPLTNEKPQELKTKH